MEYVLETDLVRIKCQRAELEDAMVNPSLQSRESILSRAQQRRAGTRPSKRVHACSKGE